MSNVEERDLGTGTKKGKDLINETGYEDVMKTIDKFFRDSDMEELERLLTELECLLFMIKEKITIVTPLVKELDDDELPF